MPRLPCHVHVVAFVMLLVSSASVLASPLPPNVMASRSANGRFLVVTERELDKADAQGGQRIVRTTYSVFEAEPFINGKDRLSSTVRFWSESASSWRVTVAGKDGNQIMWPMVSDDGRFLALVTVTSPVPGVSVLEIFRKHDARGTLVRGLQIGDLWTPAEVYPRGEKARMFTDATPEWFSGGGLGFSLDGAHLEYRSQWGDRLSIRLEDGSVFREAAAH